MGSRPYAAADEALAVRLRPSPPFFAQNRRFLSYSSLSLSSDNVLYACLHRLNSSVAFGFLFLSGCVSNALFLYAVLISFFESDSYGGERLRIAYKSSSSSSFFVDADADAPRELPPRRRRPRRRRPRRLATFVPAIVPAILPAILPVVKVVVKVVVIFVVKVVDKVVVKVVVVLPVASSALAFFFSLKVLLLWR